MLGISTHCNLKVTSTQITYQNDPFMRLFLDSKVHNIFTPMIAQFFAVCRQILILTSGPFETKHKLQIFFAYNGKVMKVVKEDISKILARSEITE